MELHEGQLAVLSHLGFGIGLWALAVLEGGEGRNVFPGFAGFLYGILDLEYGRGGMFRLYGILDM